MTTPEVAAGSPVPITLNKKTYLLSSWSDAALGEITMWRRKHEVQVAHDTMPDGVTQEEKDRIMDAAARRATLLSFPDPNDMAIWSTHEGLSFLFWQLLRPHHPDLTLEKARKIFADPQNVDEANQGFSILELTNKKKPPRKKKRKRKRKPKKPQQKKRW